MCGIGGIVHYDDADVRDRAVAIRDKLRHRGPDGSGIYTARHASLVHTRLALVDPAGGAQPITSLDGRYTLTYNGEVYNAAELRVELADRWTFRTRCDAEVVLAALVCWGASAVPRFNGMFAFFLWDAVEHTGVAARDLLGVKPFVYSVQGDEFVFASEAKAILPMRRRARRSAVVEYLVAPCFSGVETPMFEDLHYLPPGHQLHIGREGLRIERWGQHDLLAEPRDVSAEELRDAFERAVQRCLIADAPVGVFLSGGLDSTAITAAMCRAGHRPAAFTIEFEDQARFDYTRSRIVVSDDTPFAELAVNELGLEAATVFIARDGLERGLADLARINDALPAWEQELAQHHLSRVAARDCKAVLVGDAADETHYGYHFLLDDTATRAPRHILERFAVPSDEMAVLDAKYRALIESAGHTWQTPDARSRATTWLVVNRWLPRLLHNGDIHAMAYGLEARVPFADIELLALASRVSPEKGGAKAALREALRGRLPEAIRTRTKSALPKDQGVAVRYQREAAKLLAEHGTGLGSLIDHDAVQALCADGRDLDERERALLFRVICLVHWQRTYEVTS